MAIHLFTLALLLLADDLVDASRGQVENLALDLGPYDADDAECDFDFEPVTPYFWDPTCRVDGAGPEDLPDGCNADAKHVECRFCGKGLYEKITCPEEPEPEQVYPEPIEGEEEQPEPTEEEQLEPTEVNTKEEQPENTEEQLEPTEVTTAQGEEEEPEPTEEQLEPTEVTTGEEEQPEPTDVSKTVQGEEEQPEPREEQLEPAKASTTAKSKEQLEPTVSTTSKSEETRLPAITTLGPRRAEMCTTDCGAEILAGTDVVATLPLFQCAQCVDVAAGTGTFGRFGKGKKGCERALKGSTAVYKSDLLKRCCVYHDCD